MTAPDLLRQLSDCQRQLADCMEASEEKDAVIASLRAEVAVLRVKAAGEREFLTVAEVVAFTSMSKSFFDQDRLKADPRIPFCRAGEKKVLYRRSDVEAFLAVKRGRSCR